MFHDMGFMGIWWFWLIIIAAIIILVYFVNNSRERSSYLPAESPMDILKRRYAKGEIDNQEFKEKKQELLK